MERPTHLSLKGVVDHLVLLHPALAEERPGGDASAKVIAIAFQIHNDNLRIRKSLFDKALDF
jgi:hypothetical protein